MARTATYSARFATRVRPAHERKPLRMADVVGLAVGAALLMAVLSVLVIVVPKFQPVQRSQPTPEEIAAKIHRDNLKARSSYRQGSILIVDPESCTDYAFDNWTGNVRYKNEVDCDDRVAQMQKSQTESSVERMRTVVQGFRR